MRTASRTPILPLCGSIEAKGISTSACDAAVSATSSLAMRVWPISASVSTVKITAAIFRSR